LIIKDEKHKTAIANALIDEYSRKILNSTMENSKSVMDIMREQKIPMTSAYRRIKLLLDNKLIKVEKSLLTDDGKRYYLYRSAIKSVIINYIDGNLFLDITPNIFDRPEDKLMQSFANIKEVRKS
jgi:predicted transcriptional regulator|tara:strand:+ start:62 stop:436 length:375 start_codon:yes stop_codon:yes gene_type:complete